MMEILRRLVLMLIAITTKIHIYSLAKLMGYRSFEPNKDCTLVTCCTNGLGHVHQMERVLTVLQEAGMKFPIIALAKEQKVPKYKLDSLKSKFPDATFVNLNLEVDYDNGKSFNNRQIVISATKTVLRRSTPFYRKVARLMMRHRPAYCLSFWEPGVAMFINALNCPTKLVAVASQGQIYADDTGLEKGLLMRALYTLNVGRRGTLVPLSVRPLDDGIPQVVKLPEVAPTDGPPGYFVAYSTVPQILGAIRTKLVGHNVRLFVKERRLAYYQAKYKKYPHVDVRVTTPDFADQLARSRGLIASPSRGVVTQAVALGKPVYLFCPAGHIEQEYNLRFYMQRFAGIACPKSRRYRRYFGAKRNGRGKSANVTLPDGYLGRMQTLVDWEASITTMKLGEQASALRGWLTQTDDRIKGKLMPLLSPTAEELAAEAAAEAAEAEEEAREAAEAAAEAAGAEPMEEEEGEEESDDDEDEEDDEPNGYSSQAADSQQQQQQQQQHFEAAAAAAA